jgi:methylenetetrahydrofolate dehydrogenase (NADP+)/methenyltetrahydrofolate cyclohydrolase
VIIDGKSIAEDVLAKLEREPHPEAFLVAITAGERAASASFLKRKEETAKRLGVEFRLHTLETSVTTNDVARTVRAYIADPACGGIIVQFPLPPQVSRAEVLGELPLIKDVDMLGSQATRAFTNHFSQTTPPPIATLTRIADYLAREEKLDEVGSDPLVSSWLAERRTAVVGARGFLVGTPIADWLEERVASLARIDLGESRAALPEADLVITATGQPRNLRVPELKEGAVVIDFGYAREDGKLMGDLDTSDAAALEKKNITYTPTPGGTGPILVAQLFENFFRLNR